MLRMGCFVRWGCILVLVSACTKKNPEYCASDGECADSLRPFCDVNGEFEESGFEDNTCTVRPADCAVDRCGCTPGSATCEGTQVSVCDAGGRSVITSPCALGCAITEPRCATFAPSNDLANALDDARAEMDVVLPVGITIDTSTGVVTTAGGATLGIRSVLVAQAGGLKPIRAFLGKSFVIDESRIVGANSFAAVSPGPIIVKGRVDASATGRINGPGGQEGSSSCVGGATAHEQCNSNNCAPGAGGGGNGTAGGAGGGVSPQVQRLGGQVQTTFAPLAGGCRGGDHLNTGGTLLNQGGAGGGAVQLVSLDSVRLVELGLIDVGAGGGDVTAGGGSGGTVVLEAPIVQMTGPSAGVTANGGAGGGCFAIGPDATPTLSPALGPSSCSHYAGTGGTGSAVATPGAYCTPVPPFGCDFTEAPRGGGGGAAGRIRIATADGQLEPSGRPLISGVVTTGTLTPQ